MPDTADFQKKQYEFAAHIRDPEHNPAPDGVEDRRMAIYRELFFNNLLKLISNTFPVLRKLHRPEHWRGTVPEQRVRTLARGCRDRSRDRHDLTPLVECETRRDE